MCVQQRVERPAARVRERGGDQIAGGAVTLVALLANSVAAKVSSSRNAMRVASSCADTSRSSSIVTASTETDLARNR
jgi:hypothetical protein